MTIFRRQVVLVAVALLAAALAACSPGEAPVASPTRLATQTPWIIYVPVTVTPEPPSVTPLPTITSAARVPTRAPSTATRAPAATRPPSTVTKTATAPVATVPTATSAPACSAKAVSLLFPESGAPRGARQAIIFKWTPIQPTEADTHLGYELDVVSKRPNAVSLYVSHNKFLRDGQQFVLDQRAVSQLAGDETTTASWNVSVVSTSGGFDDNNPTNRPAGLISCSSPSQTFSITLIVG